MSKKAVANEFSNKIRKTFARFLHKNWIYILVSLPYLFFAAFYMGPGFTHCRSSLYGFGDSTAGPIWRDSIKPPQPLLGGNENATNYPSGETLYTPINYASILEAADISVPSKIVGSVCAYNLSNIFGYLITALVMFGLILYLTKNRWIALLAGYAVSFTPYIQSKIGGHPSYAYGGLLIAVLWLVLHIIRYRKKRSAVLLAVILAACCYFDPYFVLLSATVVVPLLGTWLIYSGARLWKANDLNNKNDIKQNMWTIIKVFLLSFGVFILLLTPLIYVRIRYNKVINSSVSGVRGNVLETAMQCTNTPLDYLLPDPLNTHLVSSLGAKYTTRNIMHRHWCGFGESRVSVSLTMLAVISLSAIIVGWEKLNRRKNNLSITMGYDPKLAVGSFLAIGLAGLILGLPPHYYGLIMPAGIVLKFTQTWRIFAREYMVVNIAVVALFAVALHYFSQADFFKQHKYNSGGVLALIFLLIMSEYQINGPFSPPTFNYRKDIPSVYYQVRDNNDITAIAEYPLDRSGIEHDSIVYYLTMQTVHKKKLFNSAAITDSKEALHIALKSLTDPQTLPALRALGIKYVVIHGVPPKVILDKTNQLQILGDSTPSLYSLNFVTSGGTNDTVLAKIVDGPKVKDVLVFNKGFVINLDIMRSPLDTEFETIQDAELKVTPIQGADQSDAQKVCFDAKMSAPGDAADLTVSVDGVPQTTLPIDGTFETVSVMAKEGDTIRLHNSKGYNLRLHNLGCRY